MGATVTISIDDQSGRLAYGWVDDKGDTDVSPPLGNDNLPVALASTSSDPSQATIDANGHVTITAADDQGPPFTISTSVTNATDGQPAVWPAGTPDAGQPIVAPDVTAKIGPGEATGLVVQLQP